MAVVAACQRPHKRQRDRDREGDSVVNSPVHDLPIEISAEHRHLTLGEIDRVIGGSLGDGDLLN